VYMFNIVVVISRLVSWSWKGRPRRTWSVWLWSWVERVHTSSFQTLTVSVNSLFTLN